MPIEVDGKTLLTYADYLEIPEDGLRHEILEGEHVESPSPTTGHQLASRALLFQLYERVDARGVGRVLPAPMDVVLSDTNVLRPDLLVVLRSNSRIITPDNIQGAPDLVVEITSPSCEKRDLELKKDLYQRFGVREHWVVRTDEKIVEQHSLGVDGRYELVGRFDDKVTLRIVDGAIVELTRAWG